MISETVITQDDPSEDIAISIQKFMLSLYPIMAKERHLLFSPFSVYFQLVLIYLGAVEETAIEMKEYLHLPHSKERLLKGMRKVLRKFKQSSVKIIMEMFIHHSYKLRAKFRADAIRFLNCNLRYVDFAAPEETRKLINSWASLNSNGKINNLIPPAVIDQFLEFIVMGAFCLEENWLTEFVEERTSKEKFFVNKDSSTEVEMMHINGQFFYVRKETYRALALPFKDEKLKMIIVLPNKIDDLTDFEKQIPELDIMNILKDAEMEEVNVTLPKFKWTKLNHKIHSQIQRLGLSIIFDPKKANFTEIHKLGQELVCVDYIKQKVKIEINEKGAEIIVQLNGLENKPASFKRKRGADSKLVNEETEKIAKFSGDSVITSLQSNEKEETMLEEIHQSKVSELEEEMVTVSSFDSDEPKNFLGKEQEKIEDNSSEVVEEIIRIFSSIPDRKDVSEEMENILEKSIEKIEPSTESCCEDIACKVEMGTVTEINTKASVDVENEKSASQFVFKNLGIMPTDDCIETKTETHVQERETAHKFSDRYPTDVEEKISIDVEENIPIDVEENIPIDVEENISIDVEENISTDVEVNISTDVEENISTDVEENILTDVEENISTDVEENISASKEVGVITEETRRVPESTVEKETEVTKKTITTVPDELSLQELEIIVESSIDQIKITEPRFESSSVIPESHNEETREVLQRVIDDNEIVPELVEKAEEVIEDCRSETKVTSSPGESTVLCEDFTDPPDEKVKNFTANHSFIFCILYDCTTLVIGRYLSIE